jgi:hypothetical protein
MEGFFFVWGGVKPSSQYYWDHNWPIILVRDDDECGAVCGMLVRKYRVLEENLPPVQLCPPPRPPLGSRWLTAWASAWPIVECLIKSQSSWNCWSDKYCKKQCPWNDILWKGTLPWKDV